MAYFQAHTHSFERGKRTYIMGILNITPDSFSDGGQYTDPQAAVERASVMVAQGADLLDIGAQSTRPGAVAITAEEEIERLSPVLNRLCGALTVPVSVDTFFPLTARFALEHGAAVINDVSGTVNEEMVDLAKQYRAGLIVMHNSGGASATQTNYPGGVLRAVREFFIASIDRALSLGLPNEQLCLDPGIGFGKSHEENLTLLRHLRDLNTDVALLTGASRKRVVGIATGETDPANRAAGTVAAHTAAIAGGTDFIRVHDVAQAVQGARMADALYR